MKSEIRIEWLVEELEDDGDDADIFDVHHRDTYAEALRCFVAAASPARIGLVRDRGNELDGLIDRTWAYLEQGRLPERFETADGAQDGALIPARYHRELKGA